MALFAHDIFAQESVDLAEELRQAIIDNRQSATGRTIGAIESRHGENFLSVVALPDAHHIWALQYGRKPTEKSGDGTLYDRILEWVKAKPVLFQDGIQKSKYTLEERTAKTITYFIHKQGTYLYRKGETYSGVRNPILRVFSDERIKTIQERVFAATSKNISSEIFKELNK